jgi:hypothetical protein
MKTNFHFPFPFAANSRKFSVSVFHLRQTNGSCHFHGDMATQRLGDMETWRWKHGNMETQRRHEDMETWTWRHGMHIWTWKHGTETWHFKRQTEAMAIFLNPFTVCSPCIEKFVVCPFVDEETNGSYPFANRLKGLVNLCLQPIRFILNQSAHTGGDSVQYIPGSNVLYSSCAECIWKYTRKPLAIPLLPYCS